MGPPEPPNTDEVSSSRPSGVVKIILLCIVALIGFYLALTQDSAGFLYLILSLIAVALVLLLARARRRHSGP